MYCVWQVVKTPTIILNNPVQLCMSLFALPEWPMSQKDSYVCLSFSVSMNKTRTNTVSVYLFLSLRMTKYRIYRIFPNYENLKYLNKTCIWNARELKRNETKSAEEYCWAITQTEGQSCRGRFSSGVLKSGFQLDCNVPYLHKNTGNHIYIQFRLVQNSTCAGPSWI